MKEDIQDKFTLTIFTSVGNDTAKIYDIDKNDNISKSTSGNFYKGVFVSYRFTQDEFADLLTWDTWKPGNFMIQGVHKTIEEGMCPKQARRLKKEFPFSTTENGIICIDTDKAHLLNIHSFDELYNALTTSEPSLKECGLIMESSASSFIYKDGEQVNGLRGVHTFIPVTADYHDEESVEKILNTIHTRSVIHGFARIDIRKTGKMFVASLVDQALKTSNQQIFCGKASLKNKRLTQDHQVKVYGKGFIPKLKALTDAETTSYTKIVDQLFKDNQEAADRIKAEYIRINADKIAARVKNLSRTQSEDIVNLAVNYELYGQWEIHLEDDKGTVITVQDILNNPKEYHGKSCIHPLENDITGKSMIYSDQKTPIINTFAHGGEKFYLKRNLEDETTIDDTELDETHWKTIYKKEMDKMNAQYASAYYDTKHVIVELNTEKDKPYRYFLKGDFLSYEVEKVIQVSPAEKYKKPEYKSVRHEWFYKSPKKNFERIVFDPANNHNPEKELNTWRGFAVAPQNGDTSIVINHIKEVLCDNDDEHFDYLIRWFAWGFQNPDKIGRVATIIRGGKGCGKSILGRFICSIYGIHSLKVADSDDLLGRFRDSLSQKCFVFGDEAFFAGDRRNEGKLKDFVTSENITIERKGMPKVVEKNCIKLFMCTNSAFAVPASSDERRWFVLDASSKYVGNDTYFENLIEACESKQVQSAFLDYMLKFDLTGFKLGKVPITQALRDQKEYNLKPFPRFFADVFIHGSFYFWDGENEWRERVKFSEISKSFESWKQRNGVKDYGEASTNQLAKYIKNTLKHERKMMNGNKPAYHFGPLREAIQNFETIEDVRLDILEDLVDIHRTIDEASNPNVHTIDFSSLKRNPSLSTNTTSFTVEPTGKLTANCKTNTNITEN